MIVVQVVEDAAGNRYALGAQNYIFAGRGHAIAPQLVCPVTQGPSLAFQSERGFLHQRPARMGKLRDKEVYHYNISADLVVTRARFTTGTANTGSVYWSQPYTHYDEWDWVGIPYAGDTYTRLGNSSLITYHWNGEFLAIRTVFVSGAGWITNYRGVQTPLAQTTSGTVSAYKRINGTVRLLGSKQYATAPSAQVALSYLASVSDLTGTSVTPVSGSLVTSLTGTPAEIADSISRLLVDRAPVWGSIQRPMNTDWGALTVECAKQLNYIESNVLSLVFDIDDWRHARRFWQQMTNLKGWKRAYRALCTLKGKGGLSKVPDILRPFASSYLFEKYAIETSVSDLGRIRDGLVKFIEEPKRTRLHSRRVVPYTPSSGSSGQYTAVLTVDTSKYPDRVMDRIQSWIGEAKLWGVYPSLANLYDILPYSFVVDWFVGYGDFVEQCDTYLDVKNYFRVDHCVMSEKWAEVYASTVLLPEFPVTGDVRYSYYHRWVTQEAPLPDVSLDTGSGAVSHSVEAGALLLQRV